MKTQLLIKSLSVALLLVCLSSCLNIDKNDKSELIIDIPDKTETLTVIDVLTKVEIASQAEGDEELIEQIKNEVLTKLRPVGSIYRLVYYNANSDNGDLIIFPTGLENIYSHFLIQEVDNCNNLIIQHKNNTEEVFKVVDNQFLIKDFTSYYQSIYPRIIKVEGGEKINIPK